MRKTIVDLQHVKNKLLISVYIFRSLPALYLTVSVSDRQERVFIDNTIDRLIRQKLIVSHKSLHSLHFLSLTKKGYEYVTALLGSQKEPLYKHKSSRSLRKSVSEHDFMNFSFIWHYISTHPDLLTQNVKIYDDSNMNHCKIPFTYKNKKVILSPDILIYIPDIDNTHLRKAVIVENDTGRETYSTIHQKISEYGALIQYGREENYLSSVDIYFVFHSVKRTQQLLFSQKGIIPCFDDYNRTEKAKEVSIDIVLSAFSTSSSSIFYSPLNIHNKPQIYEFKVYPLPELLLKARPEWKHYL